MANNDVVSVSAVAQAIETEDLSWAAEANELTELSADERRQHLGLVVSEVEMQQLVEEARLHATIEQQALAEGLFGAPTSHDWRNVGGQNYVTPVKNQGGCGSCVSFATCATIEATIRVKMKAPTYAVDLSEAFLQFCGGGSCGGWGLTSGLAAAQSMGVTDEACMPYQPTNMNCTSSRCANWANRLTKISSYAPHSTTAGRKDALSTIGPAVGGMAVYSDFYAYKSGVYQKTSSAKYEGLHAICVVGYDDTQRCWIVKNSWGTGWGDNGYVRIGYGQSDLLIDTQWAFYTVDVAVGPTWFSAVNVNQTYATRDTQHAWAHFAGLGWRRIQPGTADGVTNMLAVFAEAVATGRTVTVYADGNNVYQVYL